MRFRERLVNILVITFTIICLLVIIFPFLNPNASISSDIQKYSASVLAFLTLLYVLLTYYMLKSNNKAQKEQLRPYIIVTFPIKYNRVYFSIKNIGKRPAKNLKIKIFPEINTIQQQNLKGNCNQLLEQEFIAPNQELINLVDLVYSVLLNNSEKIFTISVSYSNSFGEHFNEEQIINLSSYLYNEIILNKEINDNLQILNKHLKNISDAIKNK